MGTQPPTHHQCKCSSHQRRLNLGWAFIADMVSDAASYDVGFGDANGFDFLGFFFLYDNGMVMVGVEMVGLESPNPWFLDLFIPNQWLSLPALLY